METSHFDAGLPRRDQFQTTIWSEIIRAGNAEDARSNEALEWLCSNYWYPVYLFIRRRGHSSHEAQDLTQGFFSLLLEKNYLATADHSKGRFRSFLITAVKWHLANEWDRARALKRGGTTVTFSLDQGDAEARYLQEPASDELAELAYDRQWAKTILEQVLGTLREEAEAEGGSRRFELLSGAMLGSDTALSYGEIARELGLSEGAVKSAVRRMRLRCGELFREEIAKTVATAEDVDDEIRYLLSLLGG